jgi:hypothetical protein
LRKVQRLKARVPSSYQRPSVEVVPLQPARKVLLLQRMQKAEKVLLQMIQRQSA